MSTAKITHQLIQEAREGNAERVAELIPFATPLAHNSAALRAAVKYRHIECVKLLVKHSDPTAGRTSNCAIYAALRQHDHEALALMLPYSDITGFSTDLLLCAADNGDTQCVALLIPLSSPKDNDSEALAVAVRGRHMDCIDLLYPVSNPRAALGLLMREYPNGAYMHDILNCKISHEQKQILLANIPPGAGAKIRKM